LQSNGQLIVSSATQDIGTGTYTILAQIAADELGLPLDAVRVEIGDSTLPPAQVSGGSSTAASVGPAVARPPLRPCAPKLTGAGDEKISASPLPRHSRGRDHLRRRPALPSRQTQRWATAIVHSCRARWKR